MSTSLHDPAHALMADATRHLAKLGIGIGEDSIEMPPVADVRRRRMADVDRAPQAGFLTLVRGADGLLDWQIDAGPSRGPVRRAARRGVFDATPIDQVAFRPVTGSKVADFLARLDAGFNDRYGLFDLSGKRVNTVVTAGKVLLIVHGTFSKCDAIVGQLDGIKGGDGKQLFAAATGAYQQVLLYEHPTLAVAPWLNALDLARAFAGSQASVDVVCHSRGGLVARWWLEVLSPQLLARSRVVFVGSPLMGTGLASPYRLRSALKLLTNLSTAIGTAGQLASLAMPMFAVVQGLATLVGSATGLLARAPIADAAVALVPGLVAMSRYGPDGIDFIKDNRELEKLAYGWATPPNGYFTVSSNFETEAVGWQFWKAFRNPVQRFTDAAASHLFAGENDLVVDTDSMSRMAPTVSVDGPGRRLEFGTNADVHHLNYFAHGATAAFVRASFEF